MPLTPDYHNLLAQFNPIEAASDYWETWSYQQQADYVKAHPKTKKKVTKGKDPRDEGEKPQEPEKTEEPAEEPQESEDIPTPEEEKELEADPPKGTPRGDAVSETEEMVEKEEYINDRASAVEQRGEDVMGSARHKAAIWKSLREALDSGDADKMFTREFLARQEPLDLIGATQEGGGYNALNHLILYFTERKFPSKPAIWDPGESDKHGYFASYEGKRLIKGYGDPEGSIHGGGVVSREEHIRRQRESYYDAYKEVKGIIEQYSKSSQSGMIESDPRAWHRGMAKAILEKFYEFRSERNALDAGTEALRKTYNALRGGKLSPMSLVEEFSQRLKSAYPEVSTEEKAEKLKEHALRLMEGESTAAAFGQSKKKETDDVDLSEMYDTAVMKREGPPSEYKGIKQGLDILDKDGKYKLRAIQWGKSVTDDEREHHLKSLVDSWSDLTDILGLPPEMASYNGRLGMAVGARGKGGYLAHYEHGTKVINLTRASGAGSLAHEWGHFFDMTVGDLDDNIPLTQSHWKPEKLSEVRKAAEELRASPAWGNFKRRILKVIATKHQGMSAAKRQYWMSSLEMFARSFERHTQRKLHKAGRENTYLVALRKSAATEESLWPTDEETDGMSEHFDKLFSAFKEDTKLRTALLKNLLAQFAPQPVMPQVAQPAPQQPAQPQAPAPSGEDPQGGEQEAEEPDFEVGDNVTLNETILGLREGDSGQVTGVQDYMVAVLFQSNPQASMWLDKDLITKEEGEEEGAPGGEGGGMPGMEGAKIAAYRKMADAFATSTLINGTPDIRLKDRREVPAEAMNLAREFLNQFTWPITPDLTYRGMRHATRDEDTPAIEADAQVILGAKIYTTSGVRTDIEIPVFVRGDHLLEPSIALVNGSPRIIAQSLVDEIVGAGTFRAKVDPRGHIFGPPLTRESLDLWLETAEDLKERERPSRGMYSVGSLDSRLKTPHNPRMAQSDGAMRECDACGMDEYADDVTECPKCGGFYCPSCSNPKDHGCDEPSEKQAQGATVDQALQQVAQLAAEGYTGIDIILAAHERWPTIAEAVIQAATEQGLLDDIDDPQ